MYVHVHMKNIPKIKSVENSSVDETGIIPPDGKDNTIEDIDTTPSVVEGWETESGFEELSAWMLNCELEIEITLGEIVIVLWNVGDPIGEVFSDAFKQVLKFGEFAVKKQHI